MEYVKLEWPDYQQYQDEDWWGDEAFVVDDGGNSFAFVPADRVREEPSEEGHYIVEKMEIHRQKVFIDKDDADSAREAVDLVQDGAGVYVGDLGSSSFYTDWAAPDDLMVYDGDTNEKLR